MRRIHISLCGAIYGRESQFDSFNTAEDMDREKRISETVIDIRHKYGEKFCDQRYESRGGLYGRFSK